MKTQWSCLVVAVVATVFGLFGSPMRAAAQCCPPPCCACPGATDLVNITAARKVTGQLQIEGSGTSTVGKNRKLKYVRLVATNSTTLVATRIAALVAANGDWSVAAGAVAAGTYNVSAEITTTDACGDNEMTTPSPAGQTINGLVIQ
jgi:hypothetical protein